jgi:predicted RNase H-like HicB family nuclease
MLIQWSDLDQIYICSLPEWGEGSKTHGKSYEAAARQGRLLLESLIEWYVEEHRKLPAPNKFNDGPE